MFNDKYQLTKAVLEGRKTQTRRIIKIPRTFQGKDVRGFYVYKRETDSEIAMGACLHDADGFEFDGGEILPRYKVGEIVAVAQSYKNAGFRPDKVLYRSIPEINGYVKETACCQKGWNNKMFVAPNLMPHQIKITNVCIQRLQDISDEDCLAEGVGLSKTDNRIGRPFAIPFNYYIKEDTKANRYTTAREAYAALLDKVSGKGTWESNPWIFVYEFELIK